MRLWYNRNSHSLLMRIQPLWKTAWQFLTKLNILLPYHPAWHLPKGVEKLWACKNLHMDVYSSFTDNCQNSEITKMSFNRWMDNKLRYCIQTIKYYSVLKRNTLSSHENTWRKVSCIFLCKRSQSERATHCYDSKYNKQHSEKGKTPETVKMSMTTRG